MVCHGILSLRLVVALRLMGFRASRDSARNSLHASQSGSDLGF